MAAETRYQSYILRFWQEGESAPWRARLEPIGEGTVKHFADAKPLLVLLNDPALIKEVRDAQDET